MEKKYKVGEYVYIVTSNENKPIIKRLKIETLYDNMALMKLNENSSCMYQYKHIHKFKNCEGIKKDLIKQQKQLDEELKEEELNYGVYEIHGKESFKIDGKEYLLVYGHEQIKIFDCKDKEIFETYTR